MARDDESVAVAPVTENAETTNEAAAQSVNAENPEAQTAGGQNAETQNAEDQNAETKKDEGPSAEEIKAAVDQFNTLVSEQVETRDRATGELTAEATSIVKVAYAALPSASAKTKARASLDEGMRNALAKDLDATKARAFMTLSQEVKTTGRSESVAKAPVDPTEEHVNKVTAMYLASSLVDVPEGVGDDWVNKVQELGNALAPEVQAYKAFLAQHEAWVAAHAAWESADEATRGDEPEEPKAPEVHEVVLNAAKIARGRGLGGRTRKVASGTAKASTGSTAGYSGPRRNVKAHIKAAFEGKPVGTFLKISEIAGANSAEYGDDHPSSGAVTASLESAKFDVVGIQPDSENGVKGARKVA